MPRSKKCEPVGRAESISEKRSSLAKNAKESKKIPDNTDVESLAVKRKSIASKAKDLPPHEAPAEPEKKKPKKGRPTSADTQTGKLKALESRCLHGLSHFCDGTPNFSRVPRDTEAVKPCKYFRKGCPVRKTEADDNDDKKRA